MSPAELHAHGVRLLLLGFIAGALTAGFAVVLATMDSSR